MERPQSDGTAAPPRLEKYRRDGGPVAGGGLCREAAEGTCEGNCRGQQGRAPRQCFWPCNPLGHTPTLAALAMRTQQAMGQGLSLNTRSFGVALAPGPGSHMPWARPGAPQSPAPLVLPSGTSIPLSLPPHLTQANTSKSNVLLRTCAQSTGGVLRFIRSLLAAASSPALASSAPAWGNSGLRAPEPDHAPFVRLQRSAPARSKRRWRDSDRVRQAPGALVGGCWAFSSTSRWCTSFMSSVRSAGLRLVHGECQSPLERLSELSRRGIPPRGQPLGL